MNYQVNVLFKKIHAQLYNCVLIPNCTMKFIHRLHFVNKRSFYKISQLATTWHQYLMFVYKSYKFLVTTSALHICSDTLKIFIVIQS